MPIISCVSPALGVLSTLGFAIADFIEKLLTNNIYYEGGGGGTGDYVGARIGYIFSYSMVLAWGVIPGVMSRAFQAAVQRRTQKRLERHSIGAAALPRASDKILEIAAGALGAAIGAGGVNYLNIGLQAPAFLLRATPDFTCFNLAVTHLTDGATTSAAAGGAGGILQGLLPGKRTVPIAGSSGTGSDTGTQPNPPPKNTRILDGDAAFQWLRDNGFVDSNNKATNRFNAWMNLLPSQSDGSNLQAFAGDIGPDGNPSGNIAITIGDLPPPIPDSASPPEQQKPTEEFESTETTDEATEEKSDDQAKPPKDDAPEKTTLPIFKPPQTTPTNADLPSDQVATTALPYKIPPGIGDLGLNKHLFEFEGKNPVLVKASFLGGVGEGLGDFIRWTGGQVLKIPEHIKWFLEWRQNHPTIGPNDRLPENFAPFSTSRDAPLSRGLRQTMKNAGTDPKVAEHILRKMEAEGASDKQIARIGTKLIRITRALTQSAQAGAPTGTSSSGATAGGMDMALPDPTEINDRIGLAMESNYQDSVDVWRNTQSWTRRGSTIWQPETAQDVDKILGELRDDQRTRKRELGIDVNRLQNDTAYQRECKSLMQNDAEMKQLWAEEGALGKVRTQCADMNVINKALGH
jgi:hypothetical protein